MNKRLIVVGLVVTATACGSSTPTSNPKATQTPKAPQTTRAAKACSKVGEAFLAGLREGFHKPYRKVTITRSQYVKAAPTWNGRPVYMVALEFKGMLAVFGTDIKPDSSASGLIIAANDKARTISDWGASVAPGSPVAQAFADPASVAVAKACLTG